MEQFALLADSYQDGADTQLRTAFHFRIDQQQQFVGVFVKAIFEQDEKPFVLIEVACHFHIINESWAYMIEGHTLTIPRHVAQHLTVLAVGTLRGALHVKLMDTDFNHLLLPTLDIRERFQEDVVFQLEDREEA